MFAFEQKLDEIQMIVNCPRTCFILSDLNTFSAVSSSELVELFQFPQATENIYIKCDKIYIYFFLNG